MTKKEIIKEMLEELDEAYVITLAQFNEETDIEKRYQLLRRMEQDVKIFEFLVEKLSNL